MKYFYPVFLCLFFLQTQHLLACSCGHYITNFCLAVDEEDQIIQGKVIARYGGVENPWDDYMDIVITERLRSDIEFDTLSFLGQDGLNCNMSLNGFAIGDELILGFDDNEINTEADSLFSYNRYHLGGCKSPALRVFGDLVVGEIKPGITEMAYTNFVDRIDDCAALFSHTNEEPTIHEEHFQIYPNPVGEELTVLVQKSNADWSYEIYRINGQMVSGTRSLSGIHSTIPLDHLSGGLYIIRFTNGQQIQTKRFVKK